MIPLKNHLFISGIATVGAIITFITITDTLRKSINGNQHFPEESANNQQSSPEEDINIKLRILLELILERQNQYIHDENSESSDEQEENSESSDEQEENSESSDEQEEELSPEIRKQLWKSFKFKQTNILWEKCSPCFSHNEECCCCCFDSDKNRKITPCGHIICYDCCVDLFDSTLFQEEQGISETKCPVCRHVIEPELVCEWCTNLVGIDSDVLYCQDTDKIVHEVCFRFACQNGSDRQALRISQ